MSNPCHLQPSNSRPSRPSWNVVIYFTFRRICDRNSLLIITLHGYSSNPEAMLRLTGGLVGDGHVIAALQAPNQHYVADGLPNRQSVPGYNWGISPHWESAVRLHHDMLLRTLAIRSGSVSRWARSGVCWWGFRSRWV